MKPGDLISWNSKGGGWAGGPKEGDYCGFLLEVMTPTAFVGEMDRGLRDRYERIHTRVRVMANDGEIITRKEYVKVIQ